MKKLLCGLAAGVIAAVMCLSFVACGGPGSKGTNDGDAADESLLGENVTPKEFVGERVTAEQWAAAFGKFEKDDAKVTFLVKERTLEEITLDLTSSGGQKLSCAVTDDYEAELVCNAGNEYLKETYKTTYSGDYQTIFQYQHGPTDLPEEETETYEAYCEKTATGYVLYSKNDDGEWSKKDYPDYTILNDLTFEYDALTSEYADAYEDMEYSAKYKGYIEKGTESDGADEDEIVYVLKFDKNGKFVAFCRIAKYSWEEGKMIRVETEEYEYAISYGAKEIIFPTVEE